MKLFFSLIFFLLMSVNANAQYRDTGSTVRRLNTIALPVMHIETINHEEPTCEQSTLKPIGAFGESITNATKVPGRLTITLKGDTCYDSGGYAKGNSSIIVKIHGNTSALSPKKPFKIKLLRQADLLCRGNDSKYRDKSWTLLACGNDIRTMVATHLCRQTNIQWVPDIQYVNLMFNGEYRGLYILAESVKRNEKCRLSVDRDEGFIVEFDPYWWNEPVCFDTYKTGITGKYTFKYPDEDDVTSEQISLIKNALQEAEQALDNNTYEEHIDIQSFATWFLLHDMLGTWDSGGSNIYITRKDNSSKLMMGNLWDFDTIWNVGLGWARVHYDYFYFNQLFNSSNRAFAEVYKALWNELKVTAYDNMTDYMVAYARSAEGRALDESLSLDSRRWDIELSSLDDQMSAMKSSMMLRRAWLDTAIGHLPTTDIAPNHSETPRHADDTYDPSGRKTSPASKGITITRHKKFYRK